MAETNEGCKGMQWMQDTKDTEDTGMQGNKEKVDATGLAKTWPGRDEQRRNYTRG